MMPAATLNVIAYNKKMVASADAPKSFWDLTEPTLERPIDDGRKRK